MNKIKHIWLFIMFCSIHQSTIIKNENCIYITILDENFSIGRRIMRTRELMIYNRIIFNSLQLIDRERVIEHIE